MPKTIRKTSARPVRALRVRRRASRGRTEMALAGLAHDIRTPLTGILAMAELLAASDIPDRERGWAVAVKDAAGHIARLTTGVVDAARDRNKDLSLHAEPFALPDLLDGVAQSLKARAEGKGLAVTVKISRALPARVRGDSLRLRSALENLIDNAVKFTERGRIELTVGAAPAPGGRIKLTFSILDTGIGMIEADLRRLFRPFSQASKFVQRRYGGAGLGLVSARRIARAMGGDLTVTSRPGRGSKFRLTAVLDKQRRAPGERMVRRSAASRLSVLCVEDNPFGRVVLNAVLGEFGHAVRFVGSGEASLEALGRETFDLVLMDMALPGIDGLEAARRIRALPGPAGRVPIVGVSGRTEPGNAAAAEAAGMNAYLEKPLSPRQLHAAVTEAMGGRGKE